MKNLIFLILAMFIMSCSSDDNNNKNASEFAGNWTGTYIGQDDNGNFSVLIDEDGEALGTATSTDYNEVYQVAGTVSNNGNITITFGTTSAGGEFSGQLSGNSGSGVWRNNIPDPDFNGTWTGTKR